MRPTIFIVLVREIHLEVRTMFMSKLISGVHHISFCHDPRLTSGPGFLLYCSVFQLCFSSEPNILFQEDFTLTPCLILVVICLIAFTCGHDYIHWPSNCVSLPDCLFCSHRSLSSLFNDLLSFSLSD